MLKRDCLKNPENSMFISFKSKGNTRIETRNIKF